MVSQRTKVLGRAPGLGSVLTLRLMRRPADIDPKRKVAKADQASGKRPFNV